MNFIRALFNSALSGSHVGKGIKLTRKGKYEEAVNHYKLALEYEKKSGTAPNPATREYLARAYVRLGRLKEALATAEESYHIYKRLNSGNKVIDDSMKRVEQLVTELKPGNMDDPIR